MIKKIINWIKSLFSFKTVLVNIYYKKRAFWLPNFSQEEKEKIKALMKKCHCHGVKNLDWDFDGWTVVNTIYDLDGPKRQVDIKQIKHNPALDVLLIYNSKWYPNFADDKILFDTRKMPISKINPKWCNVEIVKH